MTVGEVTDIETGEEVAGMAANGAGAAPPAGAGPVPVIPGGAPAPAVAPGAV